jgi:hypothetical protein
MSVTFTDRQAEYSARAQQAQDEAEQATDSGMREGWLKIAASWRALAAQLEQMQPKPRK